MKILSNVGNVIFRTITHIKNKEQTKSLSLFSRIAGVRNSINEFIYPKTFSTKETSFINDFELKHNGLKINGKKENVYRLNNKNIKIDNIKKQATNQSGCYAKMNFINGKVFRKSDVKFDNAEKISFYKSQGDIKINENIKKELAGDKKLERNKEEKVNLADDEKIEINKDERINRTDDEIIALQNEARINLTDDEKIALQNETTINLTDDEKIALQNEATINLTDDEKIALQNEVGINTTVNKTITLKERFEYLKNIEMPNGEQVSIEHAIALKDNYDKNELRKSKLSLIDYITDFNFKKPITENSVVLLSDSDIRYLFKEENSYYNVRPKVDENNYLLMDGEWGKESPRDTDNYVLTDNHDYKSKKFISSSRIVNYEKFDQYKKITENRKKEFKKGLIDFTKNVSLLDRLSDKNGDYGYDFLAKVADYLEIMNYPKNGTTVNFYDRETYLAKITQSNYFFKLNEKVNNVISLQYLKFVQGQHKDGVAEKIQLENERMDKMKDVMKNMIKDMIIDKQSHMLDLIDDIVSDIQYKKASTFDKSAAKNKLKEALTRVFLDTNEGNMVSLKNRTLDSLFKAISAFPEDIQTQFGNLDAYKYFLKNSIDETFKK